MPTTSELALAKFLRTLGTAATELAKELEQLRPDATALDLDAAGLGPLQRQIADLPGLTADGGLSPREIATTLVRGDEPNIREALNRMEGRGVVELVPGAPFKRYRLTDAYRQTGEAS